METSDLTEDQEQEGPPPMTEEQYIEMMVAQHRNPYTGQYMGRPEREAREAYSRDARSPYVVDRPDRTREARPVYEADRDYRNNYTRPAYSSENVTPKP